MHHYLFIYHAYYATTAAQTAEALAARVNWLNGLGDAVVDAGGPVGNHITVHRSRMTTTDGGENPARGYSVIQAQSLEAALDLAHSCPIIELGGDVEVAEIVNA